MTTDTSTTAAAVTTWRTRLTMAASDTTTDTTMVIHLDADGGSWLCRGCGDVGRDADHITTRGEAAAHLEVCSLADAAPAVLTSPVRAQTLTSLQGTPVTVTGDAWECDACGDLGTTPHATLAGAVHAALCGAIDPAAMARYIMACHPDLQAAVDVETALAVADLQDRLVQAADDLGDVQALADLANEERDEAIILAASAQRRAEQDVADDLRGDIRDLRSEAGRADAKASILAAGVGAGLAGGVTALSTGALSIPVLATGGAAVVVGVAVIGALLAVLRPRMARAGTTLAPATVERESVDAARQRTHSPDLHALDTERSTMQRIVAAKYRLIGHAITATSGAVALAAIAAALHIIGIGIGA